jgi:antagonist of KipI
MILDVIDGGLLTTVQDGGRPEWTHLGVPQSGAADPWSLAVANLLLGNAADAAALEITIGGPTLVARDGGTISLAGADLGARVVGGRPLRPGRSHRIAEGATVAFDGGRAGGGARAYLGLAGGVDVPTILGSRSTCLAAAFGGLDGRALRAGDTIRSAPDGPGIDLLELAWPDEDDQGDAPGAVHGAVLRVVPGRDPGVERLVEGSWRVAAAADRVGVRLDGPVLPPPIAGETLTHGIPWGAIQVPSDGVPIVLGADHQTTGGYRVIAVVITADRPALGQLQPGDEIRFAPTDLETADAALREQRARLLAGDRALRDAAGWERLAASAGG